VKNLDFHHVVQNLPKRILSNFDMFSI